MARSSTKTATLPRVRKDAREELIRATAHILAEMGPQAATVRAITALAGANTSAINYYFESREHLLAEVGRRRMDAHNVVISQRLEVLRASGALSVEAIFRPLVETAFDVWAADPVLKALRTMSIVEPSALEHFSASQVSQIYGRMLGALLEACPHLAPGDIEWRFRLAVGTIIHAVMIDRDAHVAPVLGERVTPERMIRFLSAAFQVL